jgi:hypothetical protein
MYVTEFEKIVHAHTDQYDIMMMKDNMPMYVTELEKHVLVHDVLIKYIMKMTYQLYSTIYKA